MVTDIETALIQHLLHNTAIAALVGTRIYPMRFEQGCASPAIRVFRVDVATKGAHNMPVIFKNFRIQVTSRATTLKAAKDLAFLLEGILDGFKGLLGHGSNVMEVDGIRLKNEIFDDDPETGLSWVDQDYQFFITP